MWLFRTCPTTRSLAWARHARTPTLSCRAAAKGHPWPSAAKPASCRFTLQLNIEFRPEWFDGALKIKIKNRARARAALNRRGPYLKCRSEFIREAFVAATQIYGVSTGPFLDKPGVHTFFASKLAPTSSSGFGF